MPGQVRRDPRSAMIVSLGGLGLIASHALFVRYFTTHGVDVIGGWRDAFSSNDWSLGFHLDLVACTLIVLALAIVDRAHLGRARVAVIWLGTIVGSVSLGLAVYLVARLGTAPPSDQGASTGSKR